MTSQSFLIQQKVKRNSVTGLKEFSTACGWQVIYLLAYNLRECNLMSMKFTPIANITLLQLRRSTNNKGQNRKQRKLSGHKKKLAQFHINRPKAEKNHVATKRESPSLPTQGKAICFAIFWLNQCLGERNAGRQKEFLSNPLSQWAIPEREGKMKIYLLHKVS